MNVAITAIKGRHRTYMIVAVGVLFLTLLIKDTVPLGDRFVLRGIGQGLALLVGVYWLTRRPQAFLHRRYLVLAAYLLALLLSAYISIMPLRVLLQVGALFGVIALGVAVAEADYLQGKRGILARAQKVLLIALTIACALSILAIWIWPSYAYAIGDIAGGRRFTGLYGRPAMISAAAGILFGLALYGSNGAGKTSRVLRLIAIMVALTCLVLATARTFWIAFAGAWVLSNFLYGRRRSVTTTLGAFLIVATILGMEALEIELSPDTLENSLRRDIDAPGTIQGRIEIWKAAWEEVGQSPFFGYGFTIGATAFLIDEEGIGSMPKYLASIDFENSARVPTMHNGYVQAAIDTGVVGVFFYTACIALAVFRIWRLDRNKELGAVFFVLVYLAIANMGESVIMSASTLHSTLYWFLIAYAFGEQRKPKLEKPTRG